MEIYYAICVGLITVALIVGVSFHVATLLELRRTARRVDVLAEHLDEKVESLRDVGRIVDHFSSTVRSSWLKGLELAVGLVSVLRGPNSNKSATRTQTPAERKS